MDLDLSDEQRMLADQARGLLSERSTYDGLRKLILAKAEWDEPLWRELAEMGFLGAAVPEAYGGLGMSAFDLGVISQELGRANASLPFFSSIVLAANAILLAGTEEQKAKYLPAIVSGETVATFAYAEGAAGWDEVAVRTGFAAGALTGVKTPVADAGIASLAVVLCKADGKLALALVDLGAAGVNRRKLASFDELRAHYSLGFDGAAAELLPVGRIDDVLAALFDRAAVQASFEALGGIETCINMARDFSMERQIFGRPLASYQATKHKLANIYMQFEMARASTYYAAVVSAADVDALPGAAAAAKLLTTDAFEQAARENLQIHGGIGYTFDANCHFYYRRERTLATVLGNRQRWADRLIAHLPGSQAKAA